MVSAVLSRTGRKDWHKEGFAQGEGIGGGTPHQHEVHPAGLTEVDGETVEMGQVVLSCELWVLSYLACAGAEETRETK